MLCKRAVGRNAVALEHVSKLARVLRGVPRGALEQLTELDLERLVVGQVEEPGLFFPIAHFGPQALLFPFFGKAYTVRTQIHQAYLRNQLVNSCSVLPRNWPKSR